MTQKSTLREILEGFILGSVALLVIVLCVKVTADPGPFLHFIGVEPRTPSTAYNFWSGFGSDIGEVTIIGLALGAIRHINCHAKGCWRPGKHLVDGTPFKVCAKHHPKVPDGGASVEHIAAVHSEAQTN